ncbi:MAG: hypothetical protein F7B06_01535 [Opitutae bacterium]|nr:hypothetical protein [Opitutae bacterium]MBC9888540.1 hypothetical protein [Opitutae bacterium]
MRKLFIPLLALLGLLPLARAQENGLTTDTVITGDDLEMLSGDEKSEFHITGRVQVIGTNLRLTCDELHITSVKRGDPSDTIGKIGKVTEIIAIGNVRVAQKGRSASGGRAEFFPEEGKVLLTESPVVTDAQGTVSGTEIEWFHGQRRALVRGGEHRVKVTLPHLPDLGPGPEVSDEAAADQAESDDRN